MQNLFLRAENGQYSYLDPRVQENLNLIFFSEVWGYREILLIVVLARLIDKQYQASVNFYQCHPRSLFEGPICDILNAHHIPHRNAGPLNIVKSVTRIDAQWAVGRKPLEIALLFVETVAQIDNMPERTLENFAVNLHAQFLKERERHAEHIGYINPLTSLLHLSNLPVGAIKAKEYEQLVFNILKYVFEPDLVNGKMQAKTYDGTEIRDIIFVNEAEKSFWYDVHFRYKSLFVLFEAKNVEKLEIEHINQVATYMGRHLGMMSFLITRKAPGNAIMRKIRAVYNNSNDNPPKTILILTDEDLGKMVDMKLRGELPSKHMIELLREFVLGMQ